MDYHSHYCSFGQSSSHHFQFQILVAWRAWFPGNDLITEWLRVPHLLHEAYTFISNKQDVYLKTLYDIEGPFVMIVTLARLDGLITVRRYA